jgi:hypothetical protein
VAFDQATRRCRAVQRLTAEIGISGKTGDERVRGRLLLGVEDGARLRIEALAPFGQPVFILVADGPAATLWLPRERQYIADEDPAALLEALAGIRLDVADLQAVLSGCVVAGGRVDGGWALPGGWSSVGLESGRATAYLREGNGAQLVAARIHGARSGDADILLGYGTRVDGLPTRIYLQRDADFPLRLNLSLSEVEVDGVVDDGAFRLRLPPDARPVTLDHVRSVTPLSAAGR